jgi:hypothetical protein
MAAGTFEAGIKQAARSPFWVNGIKQIPGRIEAEEAQFLIPDRSAGGNCHHGSEEQMFGAE